MPEIDWGRTKAGITSISRRQGGVIRRQGRRGRESSIYLTGSSSQTTFRVCCARAARDWRGTDGYTDGGSLSFTPSMAQTGDG